MYNEGQNGNVSDEARLSSFGRFLRRTSIDELPQLFNILKGEMSLVGPRPQLHCYYDLMSDQERKRYSVTPGLTGWSQVNGRNNITWRQRFEQDVWYIENASLRLDMWIIWRTIAIVLRGHGVNNANHVSMPSPYQELSKAPVPASATEIKPEILAEIVRNSPNSIISFSIHSQDHLQPTAINPKDLFVFNDHEFREGHIYGNFYLDIWRRPYQETTAFPIGIAGPFDIIFNNNQIEILQQKNTKIHNNKQEKYKLLVQSS